MYTALVELKNCSELCPPINMIQIAQREIKISPTCLLCYFFMNEPKSAEEEDPNCSVLKSCNKILLMTTDNITLSVALYL